MEDVFALEFLRKLQKSLETPETNFQLDLLNCLSAKVTYRQLDGQIEIVLANKFSRITIYKRWKPRSTFLSPIVLLNAFRIESLVVLEVSYGSQAAGSESY